MYEYKDKTRNYIQMQSHPFGKTFFREPKSPRFKSQQPLL